MIIIMFSLNALHRSYLLATRTIRCSPRHCNSRNEKKVCIPVAFILLLVRIRATLLFFVSILSFWLSLLGFRVSLAFLNHHHLFMVQAAQLFFPLPFLSSPIFLSFFSADLHRQLDQSARQLAQSQVQAAQAAQALQALRTQLQQQEQQITDLQAAQAQHDKQVAELQSQLKEKEQQLKAQRDNQAQDEQVIRGERTRETDRRERCGVEQKRNG